MPDILPAAHRWALIEPLCEHGSLIWKFKRNCSVTPRQAGVFFLGFSVMTLLLAIYCWSLGARLVAPFSGIEIVALGAALIRFGRHAGDAERVIVTPDSVAVEVELGGRVERREFNRQWVRIHSGANGLIALSQSGQSVAVGRFLRPERREPLALDLRRAVARV